VYLETGLEAARECRDDARRLIAEGVDPAIFRKLKKAGVFERAADSFEAVARDWFVKHSPGWAKSHANKIIQRMKRDAFPWLGSGSIADIMAPEVLSVLRYVEGRGALDTAHRVHQNCEQVFRYAIANGRAARDVCAALQDALPPACHTHFPQSPSFRSWPPSCVRWMGFDTKTEIAVHGIRAMASTSLAEQLRFKSEVIEHQPAHRVSDALGTAYDCTKLLKERVAMNQGWADYLEALRVGAGGVPLAKAQPF
jgi:hypothetical protein